MRLGFVNTTSRLRDSQLVVTHSTSPRPKNFKLEVCSQGSCFLGWERGHFARFFERGSTVNTEHYIASLKKLWEAITRKRPEKNLYTIKLHRVSVWRKKRWCCRNVTHFLRAMGTTIIHWQQPEILTQYISPVKTSGNIYNIYISLYTIAISKNRTVQK